MSATHLPWVRNEYGEVIGANERTVVVNGFASVVSPGVWQDEAKSNTAAVLLAINSHDELVAAVTAFTNALKAEKAGAILDLRNAERLAFKALQNLSRISDVQIKGAA